MKRLVFITEVESVYSAVRTESLYKTDTLRLERVKILSHYLAGIFEENDGSVSQEDWSPYRDSSPRQ
jgi:hypothetical protein